MPSPAESAVMAFFFAARAARKQRTTPQIERLFAAAVARAKREALARDALEEAALRAAHEAAAES